MHQAFISHLLSGGEEKRGKTTTALRHSDIILYLLWSYELPTAIMINDVTFK